MHRLLIPLIAMASLIAAATSTAQEPQRFALLIGNQKYDRSVGELKNPYNDIALVGAALKAQGFAVLPHVRDARRVAILGGVRDLVGKLNAAGPGAIGFIYYSGHGAAEKDTNINYLIPVDASDPGSATFWDARVKLDDVLKLLEGARNASKFVVFDACRNELQLPERTSDKGLIPVREHQGMFIAYATAPGRVASDRGTTSGPYAAALAAELGKPGLDHLNLFHNVKETVLANTGGSQLPWSSDGMTRRILLTAAVKVPTPNTPNAALPSALPPMSEAALAWDPIKNTRSAAVLEAYAKQFAGTVYAVLARERLAELQRAERPHVASVQQPEAKREPTSRVPKAGETFRDCNDGCPEMVVVPAGSFTMGSPSSEERWSGYDGREKPRRSVTIRQPFAVGKFEVTFAEWEACVAGGGCANNKSPSDQGWGKGRRPVINVSWDDAKQYVAWLSRKAGQTYRLLTEAEWEYAARAGTTTRYSFGDTITKQQAQFSEGKWGSAGQTVDVGRFPANKFGLHDMHGNVWEWVEDCWHSNYSSAPIDGSAWITACTDGSRRVLRGGSWVLYPVNLRSAVRDRITAVNRIDLLGLRVGRTLTP